MARPYRQNCPRRLIQPECANASMVGQIVDGQAPRTESRLSILVAIWSIVRFARGRDCNVVIAKPTGGAHLGQAPARGMRQRIATVQMMGIFECARNIEVLHDTQRVPHPASTE